MMAPPAETACYRCREQKLKCSRQRPACDRCRRLDFRCSFPQPPDRKLLASVRSSARKRRSVEYSPLSPGQRPSVSDATTRGNSGGAAADSISSQTHAGTVDISHSSCTTVANSLSSSLQRLLVDTYFSHMYNASLIFHRPTFLKEFSTGVVPGHSLLAVFASATIFLKPPSAYYKQHHQALKVLRDVSETGKSWAQMAGQEALQTIDTPCLANVRTCQMIALYWFSAGQSTQNTMFSGIAYKAACVLGLDQVTPSRTGRAGDSAITTWLEAESRRRLFWATWLTNCINSEHYTVGTSVNDRILNLPLPEDETLFSNPQSIPPQANTLLLRDDPMAVQRGGGTTSIMGELVQLMQIWAAIGDYISGRQKKTSSERLAELFRLDQFLTNWSRNLHPSMSYSKRNLYKQLIIDHQPGFVFVHSLHHQCWLALHISMVPQFSGLPIDCGVSPELVTASAMVALKHARAISKLCSDLIALEWDFHRLAPFVGYCIYVSASIHIVFLFLDNERLSRLAQRMLVSNLQVLRGIKPYWFNLGRLWARIDILYEAQTTSPRTAAGAGADPASSSGEMNNESDDYTEPLDQGSEELEISMLARRSRNLGRLQEPLSNSILKYNLDLPVPNTSAPDSTSAVSSLHDIERHIYTDVLGRVATRDLSGRITQHQFRERPGPQQQQQASYGQQCTVLAGLEDDLVCSSGSQAGVAVIGISSINAGRNIRPGDDMRSPCGDDPSPEDGSFNMLDALPYFAQRNDTDGWQMGLDSLAGTMLSHEELFF